MLCSCKTGKPMSFRAPVLAGCATLSQQWRRPEENKFEVFISDKVFECEERYKHHRNRDMVLVLCTSDSVSAAIQ